jgi:hypothetical protein
MTIPDEPPRWLSWTDTHTVRGITTFVALLALLGAVLLGVRQQVYIDCVASKQRQDATRTAAIARATDTERAADQRLLAGPVPGGPDAAQLRQASATARSYTDAVRAQNPPVAPGHC